MGGRNGRFWGAPILHYFVEKCYIFQDFSQKIGAPPKTAVPTTTHPIPHLTPSDIKANRGRGQDFPIFISCRYLVELGPRQLGLPVAERCPSLAAHPIQNLCRTDLCSVTLLHSASAGCSVSQGVKLHS